MADHSLRVVKISADSRFSDRYITAQIKEAPEPGQAEAGRICALVEIEGSWQSNAQIGQTIINTVARHYYRGTESDPLMNFEAALKRVNESLTAATHTGNTDWIGHLHTAIVLLVGDTVHIAASGRSTATLYRDGHGSPMLDAAQDQSAAPGKVFATLLSGTIEPTDRLLVASSGLLKVLTPVEVDHCLGAPTPDEAVAQLGSMLRAKRGSWVHGFYIDAAAEPAPDVVVSHGAGIAGAHAQASQFFASLKRYIAPVSGGSGSTPVPAKEAATDAALLPKGSEAWARFQAWSKQAGDHLRTTVGPRLRTHAGTARQHAQALAHRLRRVATAKPAEAAGSKAAAAQPESLIGKSVFAIKDYAAHANEPAAPALPTITDYTAPPPTPAPRRRGQLKETVTQLWQRIASRIEWRSVLFGLVAIVLFAILVANIRVITRQHTTEQSKQALSSQLHDLQDKLEEARLARIFNQPDKATAALQTVLDGLPALLSSAVADDAKALQAKTTTELDALTQTTRLDTLQQLAKLPGSTRFVRSGDAAVALNAQGTAVTVVSLADGKTKAVPLGAHANAGGVTALDNAPGFALALNDGLAKLDADGQLADIALSGAAHPASGIASFFGNLYALDASGGQIWKYTAVKETFSKAEGYVTDGTTLANAIDLAVDGQVYVLRSDGSVTRFNRGKADTFALAAPPAPTSTLTAPKQLTTTKDSNSFFILDGGRVLKYDKSGHFQSQYAFKDLASIDAIAVDEQQKTIYLLANGVLSKTSF